MVTKHLGEMDKIREDLRYLGRAPNSAARKIPTEWRCDLFLLNFSKLLSTNTESTAHLCKYSGEDLLHGVVALLSRSLPDMEVPIIYSTLTASGSSSLLLLATTDSVLINRSSSTLKKQLPGETGPPTTGPPDSKTCSAEEEENPFTNIISDDEDSSTEGEEQELTDVFKERRQNFIDEALKRKLCHDQLDESSVGSEHCVVGCATFTTLKAAASGQAIQLSLLGVRKKCRKLGMGRLLMQCLKDPEIVGQYEALLTFADHKAEEFFRRHGFSEDMLLTARYRRNLENWENSTLMVFTPPFSEAGLAMGSLKSLSRFQDVYQQWREASMSSYSAQIGLMERLRHELLLLHSKVQTQEKLLLALNKELKETKQAKALVEQEFQMYRNQSQKLLRERAADNAEKWLERPV